MKTKIKYLKQIYGTNSSKTLSSKEFLDWKKANSTWLAPYALYCVFKEKYGTYDWSQWKEHSQISLVICHYSI